MNAHDAPPRTVWLISPDVNDGALKTFVGHLVHFGVDCRTARGWADLQRLVDAEGGLPRRVAIVLDDRCPDADAIRRWLKACPSRACVKLTTFNAPRERAVPERLWIFSDLLLETDVAPDRLADAVMDQLALPPPPATARVEGHRVRFVFPSTPEFLSTAREWLDELLSHSFLQKRERDGLGIAVMEATDNFRHELAANRKSGIYMTFLADPDGVAIDVRVDFTPGVPGFRPPPDFDPWGGDAPLDMARKRAAEGKRGGLGLYLLHRAADLVHYDSDNHRVFVRKNRRPVQ